MTQRFLFFRASRHCRQQTDRGPFPWRSMTSPTSGVFRWRNPEKNKLKFLFKMMMCLTTLTTMTRDVLPTTNHQRWILIFFDHCKFEWEGAFWRKCLNVRFIFGIFILKFGISSFPYDTKLNLRSCLSTVKNMNSVF